MLKTKKIIVISIMTAFICIISPFSMMLPISPTPISMGTFSIYLAGGLLGLKYGVISTFVYFLLGGIGLPVFAGFMGGVSRFFAPSGGYLLGYIFIALFTGYFADKFYDKNKKLILVGMVVGTIICYFVGSFFMGVSLGLTLWQSLLKGVLPYVIGDMIKIIVSYIIILEVKKRKILL